MRRRISAFVTAITSFSNRPLLYIFQLGVAVILLSMIAGIVLMYESMTGDVGVPGWASIMVSIWFLGGVTIFCVGVLGIYLAKVFTETKTGRTRSSGKSTALNALMTGELVRGAQARPSGTRRHSWPDL